MKKFFTLSAAFLMWATAFLMIGCSSEEKTSDPNITPQRYRDFVIQNVRKQTVVYTENASLQMDIYTPDETTNIPRPVIVWAHGGAFVDGFRDMADMQHLCLQFARRGFVTATISYRLGTIPTVLGDSISAADVVIKAVHDGKAAIRFLKKSFVEDGNPYNLDTGKILVGGNSAGAVLMLHLAYLEPNMTFPSNIELAFQNNGGFEGNRGHSAYSSNVKGVISLAGGINRTEWIQNSSIPLVSLHGDADDVVPFNCNKVFFNFPPLDNRISLCGSGAIHNSLPASFPAAMYVYPNAGHCPWNGPDGGMNQQFAPGEKFIVDFLYEQFFQ
jgi:pimeloyl-ACP methyl ester carboxylesterase